MSSTVNPQTARSVETLSDGENLCRVDDHPVVDSATTHQEGIKNPYHEQEIQNLCPGNSRDENRSFASLSLAWVLLLHRLLRLLDRIYRDLRNAHASGILLDQTLHRV